MHNLNRLAAVLRRRRLAPLLVHAMQPEAAFHVAGGRRGLRFRWRRMRPNDGYLSTSCLPCSPRAARSALLNAGSARVRSRRPRWIYPSTYRYLQMLPRSQGLLRSRAGEASGNSRRARSCGGGAPASTSSVPTARGTGSPPQRRRRIGLSAVRAQQKPNGDHAHVRGRP